MSTTTTKLGLTKPATTDYVDVAILNTNADLVDAAVGSKVVTSGTRPSVPYNGQVIFETDTQKQLVYNSAAVAWQNPVADTATTATTATNATKVGGHQVFVQATDPTSGMVTGDLRFYWS